MLRKKRQCHYINSASEQYRNSVKIAIHEQRLMPCQHIPDQTASDRSEYPEDNRGNWKTELQIQNPVGGLNREQRGAERIQIKHQAK